MSENHSLPAAIDALGHSLFTADAPGATLGVLSGDAVTYARGFGLANLEKQIPFTPQTQFRACSISKQFVCLLILQLVREGRLALDAHPSRFLPNLAALPASLSVRHLCQNRSGLRDYWCAAMLTGARAESVFTLADGAALIRSLAEPMFAAGTQYSYNNGNWRILEWIIEAVTGRTVPDLLGERVFAPLGMQDSGWGSDTGLALAGDPQGYRHADAGWEREITRMCWSGDAALITTMDDMLKWEAALLAPDPSILPCADMLGEAMPHPDGAPGCYAFGINAWQRDGRWMHWHSGALRGWRMVQMRFPQDRTAIVVMLNRTENPLPYVLQLAEIIGVSATWDTVTPMPAPPDSDLHGTYYSATLDLLAEIRSEKGKISLDLGSESVPLLWTGDHTLANASGFYRLERRGDDFDIRARQFGWRDIFVRQPPGDDRATLAGRRFECAILKSTLVFADDGRTVCMRGPHGVSENYPLRPLAADVVAFDCARALDELPPGRFTIRIGTDARRIQVGCFLARGFVFDVC